MTEQAQPTDEIEHIILITTKQAAEALQIPERHIWELLADGELASLKIGGSRRIELAEVRRFIERRAEDTFKREYGALRLRLEELDAAAAAQPSKPSPRDS